MQKRNIAVISETYQDYPTAARQLIWDYFVSAMLADLG